jgi:hypothetical protein
MENDPDNHEESKILPSKQEKRRLNLLKITFYVLLILCLALSLYSWHTWKQTDSKTLLALVFSSLLTMIGCLIGLLGSFKAIQDLKTSSSHSFGYQILILSLYFLILVMVFFLIFGSRALFYSDRSVAYLNAKFKSDPVEWQVRYGSKSIEEVEFWVLIMTNLVGYTSYIVVLFIVVIIQMLMGIALKYEIINSVLSLVSLAVLILSGAVVYILVYAVRFKQLMDFHISNFMIASNVLLALFLLFTSVVGYVFAVTDKMKIMKFFIFFCLVSATLALFSTQKSIQVSRDLAEQLAGNCFDFMAVVHEDYVATLGCGSKYLNFTDDGVCLKAQQRYVWEGNGKYGCLNPLCCEILITDSKAKFDYLAICSAASVALLVIALITCFYMYYKPKGRIFHTAQQHGKILVALLVVSGLWVYLICFKIPPVPATVPYKNPGVRVAGSSLIDPRLLYPGYCLTIDNFDPLLEKCEDCSKSDYSLNLQGKGIYFENIEDNSPDFKTTDSEKAKDWLSKLKLCPDLHNQSWRLQVNRSDFSKSGETQSSSQYFLLRSVSVLQTPKSGQSLKMFGKVLKENKPFDVLITATGFGVALEVSSKFGEYFFDFPAAAYNIPYLLNVSYSSSSHSMQRQLRVGGLAQVNIPLTTFFEGSGVFQVIFSSFFIYTAPCAVLLEIRKGFQMFQGPSRQISSFSEVVELEKGVYSIIASSNGFKSDQREVLVDRDLNLTMVFLPDKLQNDETVLVVSWEGPARLDFKVSFILNEEVYCEVSLVKKICGGAKLSFFQDDYNSGFVVVKLKPIGAYQYFFYANFEKGANFQADVKIYVPGVLTPAAFWTFGRRMQEDVQIDQTNVWAGFCLNGIDGVASVKEVNSYLDVENLPRVREVCSQFYGDVKVFNGDFLQTLQVHRGPAIPSNVTRR